MSNDPRFLASDATPGTLATETAGGPDAAPDSVDRVVGLGAHITRLAAEQLHVIYDLHRTSLAEAAFAGRDLTDVIERGIRLELAAALRITEYRADKLLTLAEGVIDRYPVVLDSLRGARMTQDHAEILVTGLDSAEPELRDALLPEAIELAETEPVGTFRVKLRKLIDQARAITLTKRHEEALELRRTVLSPAEDGMGWYSIYGPMVELVALDNRNTQLARIRAAVEGEERTLDQIRCDTACDLLIDGTIPTDPTFPTGIRATVTVTVPALTLLDETEEERAERGNAPAEIEGIGPIPHARARELCGGSSDWMRILTHPETGMVLSVGRDQYRPPAALRKLLRWRAERCMAPGCHQPASRCEIDHTVAWEHGGTTSLNNLNPICKSHHRVKHHGRWTVEQLPDTGGTMHWTSPSGRHYDVHPERRTPVFRPSGDTDAPF
ncbi:HNH endonuclease signature motif containing protein [Microbacterium sp. C7(2022)]|uniref:HNH endonuclease signature motif containing protein n=1 Tax=Microbacterium sp. C7(2022) TaxID=2992759 RepID=UPI00237A3ADC|nr:HNH endonuclease signature motif containing protein [Microbacterium sp. C7(2022)]MDE0546331.1 HNH endonuclease [Microbacterium sp. C7(2022)]